MDGLPLIKDKDVHSQKILDTPAQSRCIAVIREAAAMVTAVGVQVDGREQESHAHVSVHKDSDKGADRVNLSQGSSLLSLKVPGCIELIMRALRSWIDLAYSWIDRGLAGQAGSGALSTIIWSHDITFPCDDVKKEDWGILRTLNFDSNVNNLKYITAHPIYYSSKELDYFPWPSSSSSISTTCDVAIENDGIQCLKHVDLKGWPQIKSLPQQLQHLSALTFLRLHFFDGLESLPEWLGNLSSLQSLSIYRCCKLMLRKQWAVVLSNRGCRVANRATGLLDLVVHEHEHGKQKAGKGAEWGLGVFVLSYAHERTR
ncbi:hypothetical protein LguiB_013148 [Lonicera macranthoides]